MEASINVNTIETGVHHAVLVATFGAGLFLRPRIDRRRARLFVALWLAFWSAEFWIFGPASFIHSFDEANQSFPLLVYTAEFLKGSFAHGHAGGIDASTMPWASAFISFERTLFQVFPPWIGFLIHKVTVAGTAMIGTYLLLRRLCRTERWLALWLAAFYTVSHRYVALVTLAEGIAFAGVPLLAYLVVVRARRVSATTDFRYFLAVAAFASFYAISTMPVHAALICASTLAAVTVLAGGVRWSRLAGSGAILLAAILANWFVYLYVLTAYSPESARLTGVDFTLPVDAFLTNLLEYIPDETQISSLSLSAVALLCLIFFRDGRERLPRVLGALAIVLLTGPILAAVPWADFGIPHLSAIQFRYMSYGMPLVAVIALAHAFDVVARRPDSTGPSSGLASAVSWRATVPAAFALALALAQLSANKASNLIYWTGLGGQRAMLGLDGLRNAAWHPAEPFRVSAVPLRLPPSALSTYGLEAFDGYPQIPSRHWVYYWLHGVGMPPHFLYASVAQAGHGARSDIWRCCESHDITKQTDLDLLRVANVTHMISLVPLSGGGIAEVAGPPPEDRPLIVPAQASMRQKIGNYVSRNFSPGHPYVYALQGALPRLFMAQGVYLTGHSPTDKGYYRDVARHALQRTLVTQDTAFPKSAVSRRAAIDTFSRRADGYDVSVSAPEGGVLVFNHSRSRFWHVSADGRPLETWSVNGIHMAVVLPPGSRRVSATYRSPRPW